MHFNLINLKELLLCLKDNNIECLSVTQNQFELVISKETIHKSHALPNRLAKSPRIQKKNTQIVYDNNPTSISSIESSKEKTKTSDIYFTIVSPMVGTFYRSPAPNEPFFIELNDVVKVNQTVCIVEAMKLMNEIEAEINGEIVEILVEDGEIVDCGQALMRIKPS
uniref:Biotin carboxyl carrier protein of acetyl-CoA carboxylase n=1 Tax=Hommersandiophycus borowitzkae TaxID=268573 RepID=A0A1G4NUB0_9FLOR|nr:Acetyl-CoA carboxylase, biotin carboxyl carrier protein [Hommersandiophycus borowitzkae]SCW22194.1 Acetyl-CoA carboxylase, biotin carboxyl carrier protein [Hommersandiophycus borowitzkae]